MHQINKLTFYVLLVIFIFSGCAAPLKTDTVTFHSPSSYQNKQEYNGLDFSDQ